MTTVTKAENSNPSSLQIQPVNASNSVIGTNETPIHPITSELSSSASAVASASSPAFESHSSSSSSSVSLVSDPSKWLVDLFKEKLAEDPDLDQLLEICRRPGLAQNFDQISLDATPEVLKRTVLSMEKMQLFGRSSSRGRSHSKDTLSKTSKSSSSSRTPPSPDDKTAGYGKYSSSEPEKERPRSSSASPRSSSTSSSAFQSQILGFASFHSDQENLPGSSALKKERPRSSSASHQEGSTSNMDPKKAYASWRSSTSEKPALERSASHSSTRTPPPPIQTYVSHYTPAPMTQTHTQPNTPSTPNGRSKQRTTPSPYSSDYVSVKSNEYQANAHPHSSSMPTTPSTPNGRSKQHTTPSPHSSDYVSVKSKEYAHPHGSSTPTTPTTPGGHPKQHTTPPHEYVSVKSNEYQANALLHSSSSTPTTPTTDGHMKKNTTPPHASPSHQQWQKSSSSLTGTSSAHSGYWADQDFPSGRVTGTERKVDEDDEGVPYSLTLRESPHTSSSLETSSTSSLSSAPQSLSERHAEGLQKPVAQRPGITIRTHNLPPVPSKLSSASPTTDSGHTTPSANPSSSLSLPPLHPKGNSSPGVDSHVSPRSPMKGRQTPVLGDGSPVKTHSPVKPSDKTSP